MDKEVRNFSRRDFVKLSAAGVGAMALFHGLDPKDAFAKLPKKWDAEADVVAIGTGGRDWPRRFRVHHRARA